MNRSYVRVNAPYAYAHVRKVFGVQLYKNNAHATFAHF